MMKKIQLKSANISANKQMAVMFLLGIQKENGVG